MRRTNTLLITLLVSGMPGCSVSHSHVEQVEPRVGEAKVILLRAEKPVDYPVVFKLEGPVPGPDRSALSSAANRSIVKSAGTKLAAKGVRLAATTDGEIPVYATPGEPTMLVFPASVVRGRKSPFSNCRRSYGVWQRGANTVVLFAFDDLPAAGVEHYVRTADGMEYAFRVLLATTDHPADEFLSISPEAWSLYLRNTGATALDSDQNSAGTANN